MAFFQAVQTVARQLTKRFSPETQKILMGAGSVGFPHSFKLPHTLGSIPERALRNSAVYSCVKLLAETVSSLPIRVIDRQTKLEVNDSSAAEILDEPNALQTFSEFMEMVAANYFTWSDGFAERLREGGRWTLHPFAAGRTRIEETKSGKIVYRYNGAEIPADTVLHFGMVRLGHANTMAPIWVAERAILLAIMQEEAAIEHFADGARPDYVVKLPPEKHLAVKEDDEDKNLVAAQIEGNQTRRGLYVPAGYDLTPYSVNFQQAQFRETRDFQVLEFSRIWRVPPTKIGVLQRQPAASAEQENLSFFQDTIRPVVHKIERRLERFLLTPQERKRLEIRFNVRAMLRGDIKTQTDQYVRLWQIGALVTDEIRGYEDMPPFGTEESSKPHFPVNATVEQIGGADQGLSNPGRSVLIINPQRALPAPEKRTLTEAQKRSLNNRQKAASTLKPMFAETVAKIVRKERAQVLKDAKSLLTNRSQADLEGRLKQLYESGDLRQFIEKNLEKPVRLLFKAICADIEAETGVPCSDAEAQKLIEGYVSVWTKDYAHSSLYQLLDLMKEADNEGEILSRFEERIGEWEEKRPEKESQQETQKSKNVFSKALYVLGGVTALRWIVSNPCPICEPFTDKIFSASGSHPVPPLHGGCECDLTSA